MNLKEMRAAALKAAQDIIAGAKASARELTDAEQSTIEAKFAEVEDLDTKIKAADRSAALADRIANLGGGSTSDEKDGDEPAKSLGEHFAKSVGTDGFRRLKTIGGHTVAAPEFKAATDPQVTTGAVYGPLLTQVDRTLIHANRITPVVADLLGSGVLGPNSNAVTYFVEGALEGDFTTVAQGAQKPQIHVADPTAVTDALKKIAAWWDMSDEMVEDLDFMVSEINGRALYRLSIVEEQQLLNGAGTGSTVQGILNRSGIQTETGATIIDNADAVFRAMTKVYTGSGLNADGIVIHPTDYQTFRLKKDANNQYYGGGFFAGEYGNGGVPMQPPLWGLRTVVTPAITAGTVLVGAFNQAATVYRKGGVRVESTNSDLGKFTTNIITTRIEERVALAVRVPSGFVKLTLGTT